MPHLPSALAPLYKLLHKGIAWHWSSEADAAFKHSKELLLYDNVLAHFDPDIELVLACDASQYGIGAVLAHRYTDGSERSIAFASCTLNEAEKKYSQIEKEGLACVYAVKKFHCYVYGRHFSLVTDKPLLSLLCNQQISSQSSARIQCWALTLAGYEYNLSYKKSNDHANADALSRLPLTELPASVPQPPELILLMEHIASCPITAKQISNWTKRDAILSRVLHFINQGWPDSCPDESLSHTGLSKQS